MKHCPLPPEDDDSLSIVPLLVFLGALAIGVWLTVKLGINVLEHFGP